MFFWWLFFFPPCFPVSWCQQEILCLTGNLRLPSPSAGIIGEISLAQTAVSITCPAPRRGDGGEEVATIKVEMRARQPSPEVLLAAKSSQGKDSEAVLCSRAHLGC